MSVQERLSQILTRNFFNVGVNAAGGQLTFFAFLIVLREFGLLTMPTAFAQAIVVWIAINVAQVPILRRLLPHKISNLKCNYCGSESLTSTGLVCTKCGSTVGPPKEVKKILKEE